MTNVFLILMVVFIIIANISGLIVFIKKKSLYQAAFTLVLSAILFSAIGAVLAVIIIRDPFAIFYGAQIGQFLLINSAIVFVIAILVSVVKKFRAIAS